MRRFVLLVIAAVGCQRASEPAPLDAGTHASVTSPLARFGASPEIARVVRAASRFEAFRVAAAGNTTLETIAPRHAEEPLRASLGGGDVFAVSLRPIDARAVACAESSDGRAVVCNEAFRAVDLTIVADPARTEIFELLRDESALVKGHARFAFALSVSPGLSVRDDQGRLAIVDKYGTARFFVPAPFALDANGVRRDAVQRFVDGRLEIDLDASGLTFPVLLDPGLETATWVGKTPTVSHVRNFPAAYFDSIRGKVVVAGGVTDTGTETSTAVEWDGTAFTTMPSLPTNMHSAGAVFARRRGVGWIFGGFNAGLRNNLVEYNGTVWTVSTPSIRPTPRSTPAVAYDDPRDVVVLFGGLNTSAGWNGLDDTWEHTSTGFEQKTPTTKPPGRYNAQMGFDAKRSVTVLYGGITGFAGTPFSDTWEWDGTNWKAMSLPFSPPGSAGGSLVWDPVGERLVLAGGNVVDTWAYDGKTWTKLATTGFPRRLEGAIVYDGARKTIVAVGGHSATPMYGGTYTTGYSTGEYGTIYGAVAELPIAPCTSSAVCGGGSCVAGYCCSTACTGACQTCAPGGVCTTLPSGSTSIDPSCLAKCSGAASCPTSCTVDTDCAPGSRCAGSTCVALKPLGAVCTTNVECTGGACVDGFCCDRACGGACEACDVSGKLGTCTVLAKDATPHGTRACAGTGPCKSACDGVATVCKYPGTTVVCASPTCIGDTVSPAGFCDGAGSCAMPGATNCVPYRCVVAGCTTSCVTSADCAASAYCSSSACLAKKADGGTCSAPEECVSGTCAAGVCAATPPDTGPIDTGADTFVPDTFVADTFVPDTTPVEDTAVATTPAPPFSDPKIPAEFKRCSKNNECTSGFCVEGVCCDSACNERCRSCALLASPGKCTQEPEGVDLKNECGPANTCLGTCGKAGECIGAGTGTMCARNRCVSASSGVGPAFCAGPGAKCNTDDAVPFDCAPYTCEPAFGACRNSCAASLDCANGFVCDVPSKSCVPAPVIASEDDGGCAIGRRDARSAAWLVALVAALAVRRRRLPCRNASVP